MLLILLSWAYIVICTITSGVALSRLLRITVKDFAIQSSLGLFFITLAASAWAVFGRINIEFHVALLAFNIIAGYVFRNSIADIYRTLWEDLKALPPSLKIILGVTTLLILAQCATVPYIIDNESYYIQTIKWMNEYGFVKGLANLHVFLAQTSGWHIAQSALNFSFLYGSLNDLSGFCLLLGNLFAIMRLASYFKNGARHYLLIGFLPVANLLLFQFISTPSPDMPIYVFSFMIFFYFLESYRSMDAGTFTLITVLSLFSLYIKTTAAALILIPALLFLKDFRILKTAFARCCLWGVAVLALFIIRNTIISGHPFFPVTGHQFTANDYSLPYNIARFYYDFTKRYAYFATADQFDTMTAWQKFVRWLTLPKLHGLFNKLITVLVVVMPFIIYKYYRKRAAWMLYFVMLAELAMLALSSPQYRFFLNFVLLFSFLIAAVVVTGKKAITAIMGLSAFATAFMLFVPVNLNRFTNNKLVSENSTFSFRNVVLPHKNTKYDNSFKPVKAGNLLYYTPVNMDFFWASGDGPLPCVNEKQIQWFYKKYNILPQMRSNDLADGFYAEDATKHE